MMSRDDPTRRPFEGYTGPLMTLGNMRANGVRMLDAWCLARGCNHHSVVDVDALPDDVPVPSIGPRLRCACCGHLGTDARPNWSEYRSRMAPPRDAALLVGLPQYDKLARNFLASVHLAALVAYWLN